MLTQPLPGRMWWGSARPAVTNSFRTFFGKGMSTRLSPWTWPISRLSKRYSVPPKRWGRVATARQPCTVSSILFFAPEIAIHTSPLHWAFFSLHLIGCGWIRGSYKFRETKEAAEKAAAGRLCLDGGGVLQK